MFKVTYLFHSGFTIETDSDFLIFDYFKDNCTKQQMKDCGQLCKKSIPLNKKVTFFVSHSHYDHFDKEIFLFPEKAHYVLSDDIKVSVADNIRLCGPYEEFEFNNLKIKTFGSTDAGVSFLVKIDDRSVFHAGDLNWWHWEGETESERVHAKKIFFEEIEKLKGEHIDIAFFPVDPRLEAAYYYGGEYFISQLSPKHFIPMHFQDCFTVTSRFCNHIKSSLKSNTVVYELNKRGEVIEIKS